MSYNLFLDDTREPNDAFLYDERTTLVEKTGGCEWILVTNYDEFVSCIKSRGIPNRVSFDHDLHFEHIRYYIEHGLMNEYIEYENFINKTGKHCADFLISTLRAQRLPLPECFVHSANHIGRTEINKVLRAYENDQKNFL